MVYYLLKKKICVCVFGKKYNDLCAVWKRVVHYIKK